jgi:hypothetical protein
MTSKKNWITWFTRNTNVRSQADMSRVDLLHIRGEREPSRMIILFEAGPYRYRMALDRVEYGRFEGPCECFLREEERLVDAKPINCLLLDSLEESALVMGLSPWVDDNQQECDWLGKFENVCRVILQNQPSPC